MRLTNWGDDDGLNLEALHIELDNNDHYLTVVFASGHRMRVFSDCVYVADPDTPRTQDGKKIWHV